MAAIGFGWLMAGRVLRPLHQITETAGRIARADTVGSGLHERIALAGPRDEITELADTFDAMLERLDRSFDGQRRFVANASHELRTPLAINRALIELAITRPDASAETRQLGESLLAINARHERLIDGLLMLADSENLVTEHAEVDLADVAEHVVEQTRAAATDAGVAVSVDAAVGPTEGDPVLLERLAQNLVDNGIRHNVRPDGRDGGEPKAGSGSARHRRRGGRAGGDQHRAASSLRTKWRRSFSRSAGSSGGAHRPGLRARPVDRGRGRPQPRRAAWSPPPATAAA